MKLKEFLLNEKMSARYFAKMVGCHYHTIYKHIKRNSPPNPELLRTITEATQGQVTADDFDLLHVCPYCRRKYKEAK